MKLRIKCQMRMAVRKTRIKMVMVILRDENLSTQFQVFHGFSQFFTVFRSHVVQLAAQSGESRSALQQRRKAREQRRKVRKSAKAEASSVIKRGYLGTPLYICNILYIYI